jgi:hypothetical protein
MDRIDRIKAKNEGGMKEKPLVIHPSAFSYPVYPVHPCLFLPHY